MKALIILVVLTVAGVISLFVMSGHSTVAIAPAVRAAAVAFTVVRALMNRRPADPTSQRIQLLIDEANHLLKQLDDQRTA